jgi:hypothetical protein
VQPAPSSGVIQLQMEKKSCRFKDDQTTIIDCHNIRAIRFRKSRANHPPESSHYSWAKVSLHPVESQAAIIFRPSTTLILSADAPLPELLR